MRGRGPSRSSAAGAAVLRALRRLRPRRGTARRAAEQRDVEQAARRSSALSGPGDAVRYEGLRDAGRT